MCALCRCQARQTGVLWRGEYCEVCELLLPEVCKSFFPNLVCVHKGKKSMEIFGGWVVVMFGSPNWDNMK